MGIWIGRRRFNRCEVKAVKLQRCFKSITNPETGWNIKRPDGPVEIKFLAQLECPKTRAQDLRIDTPVYDYRQRALDEIVVVAAQATCASCRLSKLSPVELEEHEAEQLEARAKRVEAQNRLKAAEQEQARLQELGEPEVRSINSKFGIDA